ncbi:malic enzyme, N-terminal domain protein, partial [Bacteriovorax sp. DB6_IX]
ETTVDGMVNVVKALEPTFGGINLEDIKAPECFEVEKQLVELMNIPVFHDDQHGTAIIASAGFINAIEISKKKIEDVKVV